MRISDWSADVCSSDLLRQIAENAGWDGAVVAGKLIDGNDETLGFNAQTEVYENLVQAGVIDPTKVVRAALQDAASVAGLLITTEAAVSELPERSEEHTSELQSLMRTSYAVFRCQKQIKYNNTT